MDLGLHNDTRVADTLINPSIITNSDGDTLYVVTRESANTYGYAQGSIFALKRRAPPGSQCGEAGCWGEPRLVVRSMSNPRGLAIDATTGTLYVLEQNTLRGFSYETFHGDVLAFCARGRYDCANAQNSGECVCATGYGGSCCDIYAGRFLGFFLATAASGAPVTISLLGALALLTFLWRLGRSKHQGAGSEPEPGSEAEGRGETSGHTLRGCGLRYEIHTPQAGCCCSSAVSTCAACTACTAASTCACPHAAAAAGGSAALGAKPLPDWLDELRAPLCASAYPTGAPAAPPRVPLAATAPPTTPPYAVAVPAVHSNHSAGCSVGYSAGHRADERGLLGMLLSTDTSEGFDSSPAMGARGWGGGWEGGGTIGSVALGSPNAPTCATPPRLGGGGMRPPTRYAYGYEPSPGADEFDPFADDYDSADDE
jgi:hypothetical protein